MLCEEQRKAICMGKDILNLKMVRSSGSLPNFGSCNAFLLVVGGQCELDGRSLLADSLNNLKVGIGIRWEPDLQARDLPVLALAR